MEIPEYTIKDFTNAENAPYKFILGITDSFEREKAITDIGLQAKNFGINNFKKLLQSYLTKNGDSLQSTYTEFTGQPIQLKLNSSWIADDEGIRKVTKGEVVNVCSHPLLPVSRLINVDTGDCATELAYKFPDEPWRREVFSRSVLASNNKIIQLSDKDISVTGSTARQLCEYIDAATNMNRDIIPVKKSVSRMGWVGDDSFSPYMDDLVPDNEDSYKNFWESVKCTSGKNDEKKYMTCITKVRASDQVIPRIALATSLASVLVKPCGGLPFVLHIWGRTSTGKTVTLMLASSVWGNPDVGKYTGSFNATAVGLELSAAFLNSLPLVLDELQTISRKKDFEDIIYELTEGTNRSRGQKDGGTQVKRSWANSIITSGEQPITSDVSGGGMVGRVIEMDCSDQSLFDDPHEVAETIKTKYGFLGKRFVDLLMRDDMLDVARIVRDAYYQKIMTEHPNTAEKQAFSASLVLTADELASEYIFKDDYALTVDDIAPFLADVEDTDQNRRGFEWLQSWITSNRMHFITSATDLSEIRTQIYGEYKTNNTIALIKTVYSDACNEAGFNSRSLSRWLKENGISECEPGRNDKLTRIGGEAGRRLVLYRDKLELDVSEEEEVPW